MVEFWRDEAVERSWDVLKRLQKVADFVTIGGWGVYLWARKLKSRDIDIYMDQNNFYRLQAEALKWSLHVKRNPRLKKFEVVVDGVEVDIYTPFMCNLVVPCLDIFREKMISNVEGFKVATPEVLLLLKAQAAGERWGSEKGMKDRMDIISLLAFVDLKFGALKKLLEKYDLQKNLWRVLKQTLAESREEYKVLGLRYEDGVRLRRQLEEKVTFR
ncbi:MAG: nucleotidyltransferase [Candidatus Hadarchaeota archaeon]